MNIEDDFYIFKTFFFTKVFVWNMEVINPKAETASED